jgi:hypothetical protein
MTLKKYLRASRVFTFGRRDIILIFIEISPGTTAGVKAASILGAAVLCITILCGCGRRMTQPVTITLPVTTRAESFTLISALQGDVTLLKAGGSFWTPATTGTRLSVNDTINTGASAGATVTFFEGSTIELQENTRIQVLEINSSNGIQAIAISVSQEMGQTISRVVKLSVSASRYEVVTPAAAAAVRDSTMLVEVAADGTTSVGNIEGHITVTAQGIELDIPEGRHSIVIPGSAPESPTPGLTGTLSNDATIASSL